MEQLSHKIDTLPLSLSQLNLLHHLKVEHSLISPHMIKSPPNYYELDLNQRMGILGAPSIDHLCKSIIMRNTAFKTKEGGDELDLSYFHPIYYPTHICVVTQYTQKYIGEKVGKVVKQYYDAYSSNKSNDAKKIGKQFFHFRQADEQESFEITGYQKGGVVAVNLKSKIPVLLSQKITELQPKFFWMGGGELNLKLGMTISDFKQYYKDNLLIGNISD